MGDENRNLNYPTQLSVLAGGLTRQLPVLSAAASNTQCKAAGLGQEAQEAHHLCAKSTFPASGPSLYGGLDTERKLFPKRIREEIF